uniref:Putative e3 ubiquitin-protein ligase bre1 n=1 Tax=Culex tarsalis TaxID=7177 RepID=A0A1Q3G0L7_CULTA
MTDPYINDSSDNESKNGSCTTKSKLESAEALLADLNLLNSATSANAANNGGGGGPGGTTTNGNNGLNGTSTGNNSTTNSNGGNGNSNNLVLVLLKEISKLHETNKKICRNLHETKVEMEALKHAPHWGLSHRRDSISGLSTNSQPIVGQHVRYNNGNSFGGGLQSPAPTYHSQGNYTPGIVSDVVREIREVSRVREEALMDRMKTLIEERSWAVNETNFRLLKETEDMKKSIHSVRSEMHQFMDRMLKLENEVITLKGQLAHYQQREQQQVQAQNFAFRERDSYGQGLGLAPSAANSAKFRRNSMHLNYGRINSTDEFYGNNFNDVSNELRFSNGSNSATAVAPTTRVGNASNSKFGENNFATSSVVNGGGFGGDREEDMNVMHDDGPSNEANHQVLLLEKDALKLRRELQDALASKQESESRISASLQRR